MKTITDFILSMNIIIVFIAMFFVLAISMFIVWLIHKNQKRKSFLITSVISLALAVIITFIPVFLTNSIYNYNKENYVNTGVQATWISYDEIQVSGETYYRFGYGKYEILQFGEAMANIKWNNYNNIYSTETLYYVVNTTHYSILCIKNKNKPLYCKASDFDKVTAYFDDESNYNFYFNREKKEKTPTDFNGKIFNDIYKEEADRRPNYSAEIPSNTAEYFVITAVDKNGIVEKQIELIKLNKSNRLYSDKNKYYHVMKVTGSADNKTYCCFWLSENQNEYLTALFG